MKKTSLLTILGIILVCCTSTKITAQSLYYYYKNEKINIKIDTKRLSVNSIGNVYLGSLEGDIIEQSSLEEDKTNRSLNSVENNGPKSSSQNFYSEISYLKQNL